MPTTSRHQVTSYVRQRPQDGRSSPFLLLTVGAEDTQAGGEDGLVFSLPVVDGGAEDTQAGAEDGPVLGLLLTCC